MEKQKYEPTQAEIEKAEEMAVEGEMTPEQEKMSNEREKGYEQKEKLKKRVLIIDDDEENIKVAQSFFQRGNIEDVEVEFAKDFEEAKNKLNSNHYDVVVSDFLFPEKTGSDIHDLGNQATYEIINGFQKSLKEKGEVDEAAEMVTEEEFIQLVSLAKEIKEDYDKRAKPVMYYDEEISDYTYIEGVMDDAMTMHESQYTLDLDLTEEKKNWYKKTCSSIRKLPEGHRWAVLSAVATLISGKNLQPLGLEIAKIVEKMNIPYIVLSNDAHKGLGSGMQQMVTGIEHAWASDEDDEEEDVFAVRMPIKEASKFIRGNKRSEKVWSRATQFLIKKKG